MWYLYVAAVIILIYKYLNYRRNYFARMGIRSPQSHILFGNTPEIMKCPGGAPLQVQKWTVDYGPMYGFFTGGVPVLVTTDLDLLHDVFVKKFGDFHGRRDFPLAADPDKDKVVNVFNARGLRWKRLRTIGNPTFSVTSLKKLMPIMDLHVQEMVDFLGEKARTGESFDIYKTYQDLTLHVISQTCFGLTSDEVADPSNQELQLTKRIFGETKLANNIFTIAAVILPELSPLWRVGRAINQRFRQLPGPQLQAMVRQKVLERKATKDTYQGPVDFISLWLDAEAEPDWQSGQENLKLSQQAKLELGKLKIEKKLSTEEIVAQSFAFLIAGFDTTALALAYVSYLLATNSEKQEKLHQEIENELQGVGVSYEAVSKLKYLDWVMKEGLRMFPLAAMVNSRQTMVDTTVSNASVELPQGLFVQADTWTIHYDKKLWGDDADKFVPERFDPDLGRKPAHPMAYIPFGAGPRQCIGMRFAQLEEKLALINIIKRFRLEATDQTKIPLVFKRAFAATVAPSDITIKVVERK